ncbi:MAG: aspartyl/asparaginyl beta-hydroxylase domain-containing protein [Planctomycetota bacterium]
MLALQIIGIVLLVLLVLLILAFIIQPALLTLPYSIFTSVFVRNPPFPEMDEYFPQHKLLLDNWEVIRDELMEVLKDEASVPKFHEVDNIQRFISAKDDIAWRTFVIKAYDKWADGNAAKVPETTKLLEQLPQITTALFSILDGGKHIPPHVGFFKAVLRYHLALVVPDDAPCYIVVGGEEYHWKEGEDVIFDDTYKHAVWNKSSNKRVVLFCDVYREKNIPRWVQYFNRKMFNLLNKSNRLKNALKKAEVAQDI